MEVSYSFLVGEKCVNNRLILFFLVPMTKYRLTVQGTFDKCLTK